MNPDLHSVPELPREEWREILGKVLRDKSASRSRVLLCLTGKAGSGKTTLARELRRKGLPGLKPSEIAVIDDGVMTAPLFGLINRRIRFPCTGLDDLLPFAPYLQGKKTVIYVAIRPEERITRCDVLVRLRCDDGKRRERLVASRSNGEDRYENSMRKPDDIALQADIYFDLRTD